MKKLFTLVILSLFVGKTYSQAVFEENFSYTSTGTVASDTLTNPALGGGIWKKHSGTSGPLTYTTGLTYADYAGSGVGAAISFAHIVSTSREDANASIGTAVNSGSLYTSFLINFSAVPASTADYQVHFGGTAGTTVTGFFGRFFVKEGSTPGTNYKLGIAKNSTSTISYTTADFNLNTTYLVVLKYKFNTASTTDDVCSIYVFATGVPLTEPTSADATSTDATSDATSLISICLRQGTGSTGATGVIDGIKVFTTWNAQSLPVTLKSISASLINNQPQVNWETSNETNFDYFGVEKSFDAKNFSEIARVASNKASNGSTYQYADINKTLATQFYRLKMVDNDGTFKYSSVVAVNAKPTLSLALYPNPVTNTIILSHPKAIAGAAVKVTSIDGKILSTQNVQTGATQTSIDATRLVKGNYVVSFVNDGVASTTQLVKQ